LRYFEENHRINKLITISEDIIKRAQLGKHHLSQSKIFLEEAETLFENKKYAESLLRLSDAIECNSHSVQAWLLCSKCYISLDEYYHAVNILEFAIGFHPTIKIFKHLDELYIKNNDILKRVGLWKKYINEFPEHHQGYLELSRLYFTAKNFTSVIQYADLGLKIKPELNELRELLSQSFEREGKLKESLFELRKMLEYDVPFEERLNIMDKMIDLSFRMREFKTSCEILQDKIAISKSAEDLERLAELYIKANMSSDALEPLREVIKMNPLNFQAALKGAAICYFVLDKKKESVIWLEYMLKARPDLEDILHIAEGISKKEDVTQEFSKICELYLKEDIFSYSNEFSEKEEYPIFDTLTSIFFRLDRFENNEIGNIIEELDRLSLDFKNASRELRKNSEFGRELVKFSLNSMKDKVDGKLIDEKKSVEYFGNLRSTLFKKFDLIQKKSEEFRKRLSILFVKTDNISSILEELSSEIAVLFEKSKRISLLPHEIRKKEIAKISERLDEMIKSMVEIDE